VPFEDYPLVTADTEDVEWAEILRHDQKVTVRYERRMARLAEELAPQEQA